MEQLILLLIFPLIGFLCGKLNITKPQDYRILTDLAFYVFLPCSVLVSFVTFDMTAQVVNSIILILISLAVFSAILFLLIKRLRFDYGLSSTVLMCCVFGNIIFLGLPLGETLFGPSSFSLLSLFIAIHNLFAFGLVFPAIVFFGPSKKNGIESSLSKIFKNTVVLFALFGLLIKVASIDISILLPSLKNLSALSTPLSLIAMGIYFSKEVRIDFSRNIVLITTMKVLALPLITFILFYNNIYLKEAVFMATMPVGISNFSIIQSISHRDQKIVLDSISLSTLISLLLVVVLKYINFF
ncbi:MAG: AEC family transporter [Candidatus Bilamarchaeum sp.]|jgi:predicted permease